MNDTRTMKLSRALEDPQVVSDLISVAAAVIIPPGVIATWTPRERTEAAEWAAAEHLHASDNTGIRRTEQPELVSAALALTANPALAQLAVEGWMLHKERLERGEGNWGDQDEREIATQRAAEAAVTGLLVLLGSEPATITWQAKARTIMGAHPEGITPTDLFALLGRTGPSPRDLHEWLESGWANGTLCHPVGGSWALKGGM